MKKLLMIGILVLLFCNTSFADSLRVVDGDTIVLNGEKIRFSGIDTPELKQTCIKGDEKVFCGKIAKILLRIILFIVEATFAPKLAVITLVIEIKKTTIRLT